MRGAIDVKESVTYRGGRFVFAPPKNGKDRLATIPRFVVSILEWHMDRPTGNEPDALVLPSVDGEPLGLPTFRCNDWKPALVCSGIDESFRIMT
jgi:hypothetical protein